MWSNPRVSSLRLRRCFCSRKSCFWWRLFLQKKSAHIGSPNFNFLRGLWFWVSSKTWGAWELEVTPDFFHQLIWKMDDLCYWILGLSDRLVSRCDISEAAGHIEAGAKKVIISAPGKGDLKTLVSFQQGYFFRFYVISKPWFLKRPGWSDIRILSQGVIEGPCFGVASVECFPRQYGSEITGVSSRWFCGEAEYCPRGFEPAALILNAIDRVRRTKVALVISVCKTDPESSILW